MKFKVILLDQDGVCAMWQKRSSCESCQGRQLCGLIGRKNNQIWSLPTLCFKGDLAGLQNQESYLLSVPKGVLFGFASMLYGLPVLILILGALIGEWLWPGSDGASQIIIAATFVSLFCFCGGLLVVRLCYPMLALSRRLLVGRLQE